MWAYSFLAKDIGWCQPLEYSGYNSQGFCRSSQAIVPWLVTVLINLITN